MRKDNRFKYIIRHHFNYGLLSERLRKTIINRLAVNFHSAGYAEEEVLGAFFWNLSDLEPPISNDELLYFLALFRIHRSFCEVAIHKKETALDILGLSKEKLNLPQEKLTKEVKKVYWQQFNDLSPDLPSLLANSPEIGIKKRAFIYLCG
ncbi:MAG: hypothetical protein A4E53_02922 [Pelotomaculum sp. PtaB.Bin104]|nr:MAG: hypothetical protein A4E53_02922 [Pelotomaculum sp. PtaB.Bin104]